MITNVSLFKPKNRIELESIRRELIGMRENDAIELMDYVFDEPYVHMDIDTGSSEIRKNFKLLKIEN